MWAKLERTIRAFLFTFLLLTSVMVVPVAGMFITLPYLFFTLPFLKKPLQATMHHPVLVHWECFVVGLLEHVAGIKIKIFGDTIDPSDNCLYLMNHRTRLDWIYFWVPLLRMKALTHSRIIMKGILKEIIPAGWAMQMVNFIFIQRKMEADKIIFKKSLDYFKNIGHPVQLLLFPEGTNMEKLCKISSDKFAKKNNLPEYDYVLHPRTTGFTYLVQQMKGNETFDAVYDMSVGYLGDFPIFEPDILFKGKFPTEVHFHIKRYARKELPDASDDLADWCNTRWQEKENQLQSFYKNKSYGNSVEKAKCRDSKLLSFLGIVSEISLMTIWFLLMRWSPLFFWYNIICSGLTALLYVYARTVHGGFDMLFIEMYNRFYLRHRKTN